MADKTSKAALAVSVVSIIASGVIAFSGFYGQTLLTSATLQSSPAVAGTQTSISAGQLCLNWATFVDTQQRIGRTDDQIDRTGQVAFGTSDALLVVVVQTLHGRFTGSRSSTTPKQVQAQFDQSLRDVRAATPAGKIVVPSFDKGFSVLSFCGSAETLRAAREGKRAIVPLGRLDLSGTDVSTPAGVPTR